MDSGHPTAGEMAMSGLDYERRKNALLERRVSDLEGMVDILMDAVFELDERTKEVVR